MLYTSFENFINESHDNHDIIQEIISKYSEINSKQDIENFISDLYYKLNLNFHPDDPFSIYSNENGEDTFTPDEATALDTIMDKCFTYAEANGLDVYDIGLPIQRNRMGIKDIE